MKKPFLFALFLAIGACGGGPLEPFEPPVDTSPFELGQDPWLLQYIVSEMGVRQIPAGLAEYRIQFGDDGAVQGQADCNSLIGRYLAEDGQLTVESLSSTKIACGETHAPISSAFSELMTLATQYRLDASGRLTVVSAEGSQLIFERPMSLCDQPMFVERAPQRTAYTVTVAPEFNASILVHELETDRPDFRLVDAGDCSRSFVASMNTNTLDMLRCHAAVEGIE